MDPAHCHVAARMDAVGCDHSERNRGKSVCHRRRSSALPPLGPPADMHE